MQMSILGAPASASISSSAASDYIAKRNPMKDLLLAPEGQSSRIMARPDYKAELTPRTDPFANSGAIRGQFPTDLGHTAVSMYPLSSAGLDVYELPPQPNIHVPKSLYSMEPPRFSSQKEFFENDKKEKNLISSPSNKTMNREFNSNVAMTHSSGMMHNSAPQRMALEPIDAPFEQAPLHSSEFSNLGSLDAPMDCAKEKKQLSNRPDLSFSDPKQLLPKSDIRQCMKDPTDPSNYMYDRTLFAPLKRRYNTTTDYIRGDVYIEPNRFGWFDTPANPGTDLNVGFFNLNYPSFQQNVELEDSSVQRLNPSLTASQFDQISGRNPYAGQSMRRGP